MNPTIELTQQLIACPSITPEDAGCQEILIARLEQLGFHIELMPFGNVKNFWARRGTTSPLFVFVGHTDVVPTGPLEKWHSPPFEPEMREGYLYGRGGADMKGSLAAMLVACENFVAKHPEHSGSIAWLITSDEEGPSVDGTKKVAEILQKRGEKIDFCLVGEPSCEEKFGDVIKIGRRGTLSGKLIIHGRQGHIAYPHLAENPIHKASAFIHELTTIVWDEGNDFFSPTSLQISNIHAGTGAGNVIPGDLEIQFNFRYSPALNAESLQKTVVALLKKCQLRYSLEWRHSGNPFLTPRGEFANTCEKAIHSETGISPVFSTHGGTSDGRFIAPLGAEVVEFGPRNRSIHQIDECVCVEDLVVLTRIYERILEESLEIKK